MAEKSLLSIIVTSYTIERLRDICELIDSIIAQDYPNIEVVIVVERSAELLDKVKEYAGSKHGLSIESVYNDKEPGLSASRNLGVKMATGDILAFVDDDVLLLPGWAQEMVKTYDDDSVIGVTGPTFPAWQDKAVAWLPEEFYWIISCTAWFNAKNDDKQIRSRDHNR